MFETKVEKIALLGAEFHRLQEIVESLGQKPFRAKQLHKNLMQGRTFDEMTDLPKTLKEELALRCFEGYPEIVTERYSSDGTKKYLFSLSDQCTVESVLLNYEHGNTACISTQVGCACSCVFCTSGEKGLIRNLKAYEIYAQVLMIGKLNGKVSNVVLMGSGEPLHNLKNIIGFFELMSDEQGLNIGLRNISLSTVGVKGKIRELVGFGYKPTLCLSLHAPNDEIRRKIIPYAVHVGVDELIEDLRYYFDQTGRRVIIEYILIQDINSELAHARELAKRLKGLNCHVNLIPKNGSLGGVSPGKKQCYAFLEELNKLKISATLRRTLGADIEGACGQLKATYAEE